MIYVLRWRQAVLYISAGTSVIENGRNSVKLWLFEVFNRFLNCPSCVAAGLFSYHNVLDPLER